MLRRATGLGPVGDQRRLDRQSDRAGCLATLVQRRDVGLPGMGILDCVRSGIAVPHRRKLCRTAPVASTSPMAVGCDPPHRGAAALSLLHRLVPVGDIAMRKLAIGLTAMLWCSLTLAATPKQVVLDVQNMTCPTCSITIEKALDNVPGVSSEQIDLKTATVTVTFDVERTDTAVVVRAITEAGFPAKVRDGGG